MADMWDESLLANFDNLPGLRLVDYRRVGIPVYLAHIDVLIEERRELHLLSEYCLRLVGAGVFQLQELANLMGLAPHVIRGALADLLRSDAMQGDEDSLSLTIQGQELVEALGQFGCVESTWYIPVDGILNRPYAWRHGQLYTPRQLFELGHQAELTPFGERPLAQGLDINEVWQILNGMRPDKDLDRLLAIRNVRQAPIRFVPVIQLAYRADSGQIQTAFLLDGRLLEEHGNAFVEKGGLKRPAFRRLSDTNENVKRLRKDARRRLMRAQSVKTIESREPRPGILSLPTDRQPIESLISEPRIYELSGKLTNALASATKQLIITSRTISPILVSDNFLRHLEDAVERGVNVYLGIGSDALKTNDSDRSSMPPNVIRLVELQSRLPQLQIATLEGLDYTHLIVDASRLVIGDFDWLAVDGTTSRTFQDRWFLESLSYDIVSREAQRVVKLFA